MFLPCSPVAAIWFSYLLGLLDLLSVHAITIHSGKLLLPDAKQMKTDGNTNTKSGRKQREHVQEIKAVDQT